MPKRLKSLTFVNQTLGIGGAETLHSQLLKWLSDEGVAINVYTTNRQFADKLPFAKVEHTPIVIDIIGDWKGFVKGFLLLPIGFFYYGWLTWKSKNTDLIFLGGYIEKVLVSPWSNIFGIPIVWIDHGPLSEILSKFFGVPKLLYLAVKNVPAFIVTPSRFTAYDLEKNLGVPKKKLKVIPNAIFEPKVRTKTLKTLVCCVSRLEKGKGQDLLIEAWQKVAKKMPQAHLNIVGEGDMFKKLKDKVADLKLGKNITLKGWVTDALIEIAEAEVFVFPSTWPLEGFGIVTIEAMSLGKPVVGFATGPLPEIVDMNTGILVPPGDINSLASAIINLLKDEKLRMSLGQNARKKYEERFTFKSTGKKYLKVIEKAILLR